MANCVRNKQVLLRAYVRGVPQESDLLVVTQNIQLKLNLRSGSLLLKNLYLSCDPYMGILMKEPPSPIPPFKSYLPNKPLYGMGVAQVLDSYDPAFKRGDIVFGLLNWEEYSTTTQRNGGLTKIKIDTNVIPLTYATGILGMIGLTAYGGFFEICSPKRGETVFVSAASGAVGQLVGQFAKLMGCYVVGSAGSNQKVDLLLNNLGFNGAFNYKEERDLDSTLKRYFPRGIDIYFDNVGGKMLDTVLLHMKDYGRIAACGMISQYHLETKDRLQNLPNINFKKIRMQGFVGFDFLHLLPKYVEFAVANIRDKKLIYVEDVVEGLENGPSALVGLLHGQNFGKKIVKVT